MISLKRNLYIPQVEHYCCEQQEAKEVLKQNKMVRFITLLSKDTYLSPKLYFIRMLSNFPLIVRRH